MYKIRSYLLTSIITVFFVEFACSDAFAADKPADAMTRIVRVLTKPESLKVGFEISQPGMNAIKGSATMCKVMFKIDFPDMHTGYDGHTQWVWVPSQNEVTYTQPTGPEVTESNPFRIITRWGTEFDAQSARVANGRIKITLVAKRKDFFVTKAVVTADSKNYRLLGLDFVSSSGNTNIKITSVEPGSALPKSYFVFNSKATPGIYVNDLR